MLQVECYAVFVCNAFVLFRFFGYNSLFEEILAQTDGFPYRKHHCVCVKVLVGEQLK